VVKPVVLACTALAVACQASSGGGPAPLSGKIAGAVSGAVTAGVTVTLTGAKPASTTTGPTGTYAFDGLPKGAYTITPSLAGYSFNPASRSLTLDVTEVGRQDFTAGFSISGTVSGVVAAGVKMSVSGAAAAAETTDASGSFWIGGLPSGAYTVAPLLPGYVFTPASRSVALGGASAAGQDFSAGVLASALRGRWTAIGPSAGGRIDGIVADDANPSSLWIGAPGGGVWHTADNGAHWTRPASDGLTDLTVVHFERDRADARKLWAVTPSNLFFTLDEGAHFIQATRLGPPPLTPANHSADPPSFVQFGVPGGGFWLWARPCDGLWYSTDGASFARHFPFDGGTGNPLNCIDSVAADELSGTVMFSTMGAASVFRSTCPFKASAPCFSWAPASDGLPANSYSVVLGATPGTASTPGSFSAAVEASPLQLFHSSGGAWSKSTNDGLTWDPRAVLNPFGNDLWIPAQTLLVSLDLGATFKGIFSYYSHPDVRGLYRSGSNLWITTDGSFLNDHDNIIRWDVAPGTYPTRPQTIPVDTLPIWQEYFLQPIKVGAQLVLYAGSQDNGSLCSANLGTTWAFPNRPGESAPFGDVFAAAVAPSDPTLLYALGGDTILHVARVDTATCPFSWTRPSARNLYVDTTAGTPSALAVHPLNASRVYVATGNSVVASTDGGATFTAANGALPRSALTLYVERDGTLYAGTRGGGAFVSTNSGASFVPWALTKAPPATIRRIAKTGDTWLVASSEGLYRKTPTQDWSLAAGTQGRIVSDVIVDPACPSRVYAAFGYAGTLGASGGGIAISSDQAASFAHLGSAELDGTPISALQLNPLTPGGLFIATYGLSGWRWVPDVAPSCP
jgi:hypothetical protein